MKYFLALNLNCYLCNYLSIYHFFYRLQALKVLLKTPRLRGNGQTQRLLRGGTNPIFTKKYNPGGGAPSPIPPEYAYGQTL